jgi:hypothetical protein
MTPEIGKSMKKLLITLFIICAVLLSGVYLVGEKTENEIYKIFSQGDQQGQAGKLLSYDRQFLKATAVSQVTLTAEGEEPIVFIITSIIHHYPYNAVINNKIRILDQKLRQKMQGYFDSDNWIRSTESINLFGQLTGQLQLLPGSYDSTEEKFSTKRLQVSYRVNLKDYSGTFNIDWDGLEMQTSRLNASMTAIKLSSDFASLPVSHKYNYVAEIAKMVIQQAETRVQLQDIGLRGSSRLGEKVNTLDSSNEWHVASYLIADGEETLFTDNHLQLDLNGLYTPALALLRHISDAPELVAQGLTELMAHGGEISLTKLTSQTPWGKVKAGMDLVLQEGGNLSEMIENPFMLLDYTSGSTSLFLPDSLLQLPALSDYLQIGLQSGLLKREKQTLTMETQLDRGELTVNGRVIPL